MGQVGYLQDGGSKRLACMIKRDRYELVVIDTLARAAPGIDPSDPKAMVHVLEPLHEISHQANCTVLLTAHLRKPGALSTEDIGNELLGSTTTAATPDTLIGLFRDRGAATARLEITGHDVIDETLDVEFDLTTGTWRLAPTVGSRVTPVQQQALDAITVITTAGRKPTLHEIALQVQKDDSNMGKVLNELQGRGLVRRDPTTKIYTLP